jgi:hypothetical protein
MGHWLSTIPVVKLTKHSRYRTVFTGSIEIFPDDIECWIPFKVSGTTAISGARKLQYYTTQEESPMQRTIKRLRSDAHLYTKRRTPCHASSYAISTVTPNRCTLVKPQSVSTSPFASASSKLDQRWSEIRAKASEPVSNAPRPIASASKSGPTMTRDTHASDLDSNRNAKVKHAVRPERAVTGFCYRWSHRYAEARQDHYIHLQDAETEIEVDSVYISERSGGTDDKKYRLRPVYGRSNERQGRCFNYEAVMNSSNRPCWTLW